MIYDVWMIILKDYIILLRAFFQSRKLNQGDIAGNVTNGNFNSKSSISENFNRPKFHSWEKYTRY